MKALDFFTQYGAVANVFVAPFSHAIQAAVDNGWLTDRQALTIISQAATESADIVATWTPETPIGFTAENNPLADVDSPCAKLARLLASRNDEEVPQPSDFPRTPQGEAAQQARI